MADDKPDNRSEFLKQLDRTEDVAVGIGLVASGIIFTAGLAGLLFVIFHVFSATPPSWGSQGEWLYGAIACLLIAGYGFGQAASLYARRARASAPPQAPESSAKFHIGRDGLSLEIGKPSGAGAGNTYNASWSSSTGVGPVQAVELTEEQVAAADIAALAGLDWGTVCRQINPEYSGWPSFQQNLYRRAVQYSVEKRRQPK